MADTQRFTLPLLDAAQAQKHVTMNESLARLDALAAQRFESLGGAVPPGSPAEGEVHLVGPGATGDWAGQDGQIAYYANGGWEFAPPYPGQRAWDAASGTGWTFTASGWVSGVAAGSAGGALSVAEIAEIDHAIASGPTSATVALIPDKAVVIGVTARVTAAIGGASSWSLGVAGSPDRYGTGFGTGAGSFAHGVTGQPQAYFGATPLLLTAAGADFTGGTVRIAVHFLALSPPLSV